MYNQAKIKRTTKLIVTVSSVVLLLVGFLIGSGTAKSSEQKKQEKIEEKKSSNKKPEKESSLSSSTVEKFLIAHYTKKDLGENRNRYEPLVTTSMLNEMIATEKEPVNQAYKGYLVNQVFEKADIYVNTEDSSAIAFVTYKNTQLSEKGSYENALKDQTHQEAIKLTFLKQGKSFLVNRMEYVSLTQPLSESRNSYKSTNEAIGVQRVEETDEEKEALEQAKEESKGE